MMSFYSLPSTIMQHPKYDVLNAAYMFYYATDCVFSKDAGASSDADGQAKLSARLNQLVGDLLVMAKKEGFDVVNTLTLMDNNLFLQDQKVSRWSQLLRRSGWLNEPARLECSGQYGQGRQKGQS